MNDMFEVPPTLVLEIGFQNSLDRLIREIRKRARSDLVKYKRTLNLVRSGTQSLIRIKSVPIQFWLNLDVKE